MHKHSFPQKGRFNLRKPITRDKGSKQHKKEDLIQANKKGKKGEKNMGLKIIGANMISR